jgi:hypothetical protein
MSSTYPGTIDVFTNPAGTDTLDSPDHAGQHSDANDAIESMQAVMGTTAGTSVLMNFGAGEFPVKQNGSNVLQDTIANGTATAFTITSGTATTITTTSLTTGTAVIDQAVSGTAVKDEDDMASNSATALATQQSIKAYVDTDGGSLGGWTSATGTWAYASATTITVPSGAGSIYQKGDKFKLTANSVVLYGYIITVADTLLTVAGDTLTEHAFTANYYSHAENPIGFPDWFAYTPTVYGSTSAGTGTYAIQTGRFNLKGRTCNFSLFLSWSAHDGSGATRITAPLTAKNVENYYGAINVMYTTNFTFPADTIQVGGYITFNSKEIVIIAFRDATTPTIVALDTVAGIMVGGTYEIE